MFYGLMNNPVFIYLRADGNTNDSALNLRTCVYLYYPLRRRIQDTTCLLCFAIGLSVQINQDRWL